MKNNKGLSFKLIFASILLTAFASCQLFENDVADFMEKYTETAAIETCSFNVETYQNALSQRCIASEEDTEVTMLMRNPKQFSLIPSVTFSGLSADVSRESVDIAQTDTFTILLSLPQDFLIPADEGKDITADIRLYEPMSGRDFDHYIVDLHCDTKPPLLLNPTIINNSNSTFVVAFDMPSPEEVAVRHKDISAVEINGHSYPVIVTTRDDPDIEGAKIAEYEIADSHFSRTAGSGYTFLGGKEFTANSSTSFYYETGDTFFSGDQEYSLILRDRAGLESTVKASTSIAKLEKPRILDQSGYDISEDGLTSAPFNENTEIGTISIVPPTEDHLGNPVSGTTVYYKVYEATGSGLIYTSGTTTTAKSIDLPQNTYRVEAYATLTNYENSSTRSVKFRFLNNVIFVDSDNTDPDADGSESSPYPTIMQAIESINDLEMRPERRPKYTLYVKGTHGDLSLGKLNIDGVMQDINTDELVITRKPGSTYTSVINSISANLDLCLQKLTIGNITISNQNTSGPQNGISHTSPVTALYIDGTTIENCTGTASGAYGVYARDCGPVTITNATISNNATGINGESCNITITGGTIYHNKSYGLIYGGDDSKTCTMTGVELYENGYDSSDNQGIYLDYGELTLTNCNIHHNYGTGIFVSNSSTCKLYGGSVKNNNNGGISVTASGTNHLQIKGAPVVQNNTVPGSPNPTTTNVSLADSTQFIEVVDQLTSGCRVGVTHNAYAPDLSDPDVIGAAPFIFTSGYKAKNGSASPSNFFTSDGGFAIVPSGVEAGLTIAGASGQTLYDAFDYNFGFAISDEQGNTGTDFYAGFYPGITKKFVIKPIVTRTESSGDPTDVTYNGTDKKLRVGTDVQGGGAAVIWTAELYNGGSIAASYTSSDFTAVTGGIKLSVNQSYIGSYTLKVHASYLGIEHSAEYSLDCSRNADSVSDLIKSLNMSPAYTIVIDGNLDADELYKVWDALSTAYGRNPDTRISIDATNTACSNPDSLNSGVYANESGYFEGDMALESMILPDWMMRLTPKLFKGCTNLESITIPDTVTRIYGGVFAGCTNLTTINFNGTKAQWTEIDRVAGWHTGVPATQVHCLATNETCPLDYGVPLTGGVSVPGTSWTSTTTLAAGETNKESLVFIANRNLTISNLWVSDHETTQAEYFAIMGTNPSYFSSNPYTGEVQENRPVENVSWYDALVYCNRRSISEGLTPCYTINGSTNPDDWGTVPTSSNDTWNAAICDFTASTTSGYRLPTEAEWEYCARGRSLTGDQFTYSGTNGSLGNYAWYSGTAYVGNKTHEVSKKQPNALDLYDMSGNVYEWCWDWAGNDIDSMTAETGATSGTLRATRGGNYTNNADCCRVNFRDNYSPYNKGQWLGFRVVRSIP